MNDFNLKKEADSNEPQVNAVINNAGMEMPEIVQDPAARAKELLTLHYSIPNSLNFDLVNELALECCDEIFEHWLPDGQYRGKQYLAYNPTRNDGNLGSFTINTDSGVWSDFADDKSSCGIINLIHYITTNKSSLEVAVEILEFIAGFKTDDIAPIIKRNIERKTTVAKEEYELIMPIPEAAQTTRKNYFGSELGTPVLIWEYKNETGEVMFYVLRFTLPNGGKEYRQLIYCRGTNGNLFWKIGAPPAPRIPYRLDQVAARPEAIVLFAEGEKSADAAQRLFPEHVAVTTICGAKSPDKTDFNFFAGRKVLIAPDNDESGMNYVTKLIGLLRGVGADVVGVMNTAKLVKDPELSKGYDLADAEVEGWTAETLSELGDGLWSPVTDTVIANKAAANQSSINAQPNPPTIPAEVKKTPRQFAFEFANSHHNDKLAYFNNQIVAYRDGFWPALNIDVDVKKPLLGAMDIKATASKVNGVLEMLKIMYATLPEQFERKTSRPLICLNNGTLDPITGELLPHSAEHFLSNKLDITYDSEAQCPVWLKTLDEIFQPDADKAEKIQLLQEFIGYSLIPDTRYTQFLWMVGEGGNGKSLILNVMTSLIGKENISYAQLEDLENKFVRAELQGKLLNMSSEMSSNATISDGYLKQLTSGDSIQAERKNEKPFSFKPYARIVGATNVLPRLLDHSGGFGRRAMIMRLNRVFKESEQDKQLESKILSEMPGLLNWAVKGLQRLLNRKSYVIPDSCIAELNQYRINSDPIKLFAEECLTVSANKAGWISGRKLYENYVEWNENNGYKKLANNQFGERLIGAGFTRERTKQGMFWHVSYYRPGYESIFHPEVNLEPRVSPLAGKYQV